MASPNPIDYGQSTTLHWDVSSAVSLLVDGQPVTGSSLPVRPMQTKTYTLAAHGPNQDIATAQTTVGVNIVSLSNVRNEIGVVLEIVNDRVVESQYFFLNTYWTIQHVTSLKVDIAVVYDTGIKAGPQLYTHTTDHLSHFAVMPYRVNLPEYILRNDVKSMHAQCWVTAYGPGPTGQVTQTTNAYWHPS